MSPLLVQDYQINRVTDLLSMSQSWYYLIMRQSIVRLLMAVIVVLAVVLPSQARDVPFTQEDRDRIIRLEEGLKSTNQRIDALDSSLNKRIDDIRADMKSMKTDIMTLMLWGFGVLFGGMGLLLGFVLWDRRTALAPAIRKTKEIDERSELLVKVLKETAAKNPDLKDALKHAGLL
ncbi:MAG: hypothetical protein HQL06_11665 [Nitrospirae bacterium]|nr:hypothetical protein [Nitrospirota bacterium]